MLKTMKKTYRKGVVGAMMDEYERAVGELKLLTIKARSAAVLYGI